MPAFRRRSLPPVFPRGEGTATSRLRSSLIIQLLILGKNLIHLMSVSFGADNIFLHYKTKIARSRLHALEVTWFLDDITRGWGGGGIMYLIGCLRKKLRPQRQRERC